ncbi:hypothetical protein [Bartonella sp. MU37NMGALS]|uniref:hypothetical protein n=1 Tax=Bartonella sp. MU37NMGALS TaxID=3243560 RepID=UPI0035CF9F39
MIKGEVKINLLDHHMNFHAFLWLRCACLLYIEEQSLLVEFYEVASQGKGARQRLLPDCFLQIDVYLRVFIFKGEEEAYETCV